MLAKNFNKNQYQAVIHNSGPLLVTAGAGSGKTRVLTGKLAQLLKNGIPPEKIIAITFTNKAAKEIKRRVASSLPMFIGTFHSFGARILRTEAKYWGRSSRFTIYDKTDSLLLIKKIIKNLNLPKEKRLALKLSCLISKTKSTMAAIKDAEDEVSRQIFEDYEKALQKNNAFDFDDLIEKPARLFQRQPDILKKYQCRYQYILIDEFQDTNACQYLLVKLLAQKHRNISIVGDDAQSIYSWRYADFRNILNFDKDWPKTTIVFLEENYRSTANIIKAANQLIKHNKLQRPKNLWTKNPAGEKIIIAKTATAEEEAEWLALKIKSLPHQETTAALYRTNAQSRAIEQALIQYQISYQIFGGVKFYERKEIKDIMAALRLAANPQDKVSKERLQKNFSQKKSRFLIKELPLLASKLTPAELIGFVINQTDYFHYLENNFSNSQERKENVKELINFAYSLPSLDDLLENASLAQSADDLRQKSFSARVKLMTIHLAKGLEFDAVFLAGCNESILPHQRSLSSQEELEEERRLMYVAMTRARRRLFLSFYNLPSRFLYELPSDTINFCGFHSPHPTSRLADEEERYIEYE